MPKIQCPHCKAVNQDVSADDPCWQCGTILGAPESAIDTGTGAPTSEANPGNKAGSSGAPIQKQIERTQPQDKIPLEQRHAPSKPNYAVMGIALAVLALIFIAILYFMKVIRF